MGLSNVEIAGVLREAVAVIEKQGWCQNSLGTPEGKVCMAGAVGTVLGLTEHSSFSGYLIWKEEIAEWYSDYMAVVGTITCRIPDAHIPHWNDAEDRTEEDVKKFLLKTADEIEVQ